jgi:hypothetical protein
MDFRAGAVQLLQQAQRINGATRPGDPNDYPQIASLKLAFLFRIWNRCKLIY